MAAYCSWLVCNNKFILCLVIAIYCTSFVATQNVNFYYHNVENSDHAPLLDDEILLDSIELNVENVSYGFAARRILYPEKVQFQDLISKTFASFSTFFTFSVNSSSNICTGDGLAFIIVANNTPPPANFSGGTLGLLIPVTNGNASNHVFAVEIDTFQNLQYNDPSGSHVGVDINSLNSTATYDFYDPTSNQSCFVNQGIFGVWIDYSATNETLYVAVQPYTGNASTPPPSQIVVYNFTLSNVLEDDGQMYVGFSSATRQYFENNYIYSWRFSTSGLPNQISPSVSPSGLPNQISPSGLPNQISPSVSPSGLPNQISPSGLPNQISPTVSPSRLPNQISPSVSPSGLPNQISPTVSPSGLPNQISPSVSHTGLPNQISPIVSHTGLPNQISPSGLPNQISPTISPSRLPNQISPSVSPSVARSGLPKNKKSPLIAIVLTCGIIFMGGAILGAFFFFKRKSLTGLHVLELGSRGNQDNYDLHLEKFVGGPRRFSYKELKSATKSFSPNEMLGRGGFGCVYKGVLRDTCALVAVKKIAEDSQQGGREFFPEVSIISRVRHRNLVQLQGWCCERSHLMLVYDYMPNKSLDKILYRVPETSNTIELTWDLRYNILIGVSSALTYLHEEWEQCVVHRDVKPSNVMLDEELNPRLGDFGLARLIARTKNAQTTIVAGTLGYMAPELSTTGKATTKTDVFSYGALALEVACGRRPIDLNVSDAETILLDWVWMCYENGELFKVVDVTLGTKFNEEQISTVLLLGLLCSHPDPNARPTMGYVHQVLTGNINLPPIPFHKPIASYSTQNGIEFMDMITSSTSNDGEPTVESSSIPSKLDKS